MIDYSDENKGSEPLKFDVKLLMTVIMEIRSFNLLSIIVIIIVSATIGAWIDHFYMRNKQIAYIYDDAISDLAREVYLIDALRINKIEEAKELILSSAKGNLIDISVTHSEIEIIGSIFPCALVKKVRQYKRENIIIFEKSNEADRILLEYLNTHCLGEPSHKNIAKQKNVKND